MSDTENMDYDVIVIGGGGAGMSAAIQAADAGAHVALLEAGERLGGSTALAGGLFYAAGTAAQKANGITDTPDAMFRDIMALNDGSVQVPVIRRLCDEAPGVMEWLISLGVEFPADRLSSPNGRSVPRSHEPIGFGAKIAEQLDFAVSKRPIDVARKTRVERLLKDAKGRVNGVKIGDDEIHARAVVIASGGYGGNPELVSRMMPKAARAGDWVWHVGCKTNRGDGLRMAEAAGAAMVGQDSGLLLLTPNFFRDFEVIGPDWALMVNTKGQRFVREDGAYWEIAEGIEAQADSRAFCVFDRPLLENAKPHPRVLEALEIGAISLSWITRVLEEQLAQGHVLESPTVAGLAQKMGVDAAALSATLEQYNRNAAAGRDPEFDKTPSSLKPIHTPPYYAVEVRPAILTLTGGGMPIDADARVLDGAGRAIPGLYAAGETLGNMYGEHYVGSGYAIASCITFGCVAGRSAAAHAKAEARAAAAG
jgi:fumarate reductase flavoprotein subunit